MPQQACPPKPDVVRGPCPRCHLCSLLLKGGTERTPSFFCHLKRNRQGPTAMHVSRALQEAQCRCLLLWEAGVVCAAHACGQWVCGRAAGSRLTQGPFKSPTGIRIFLTAKRCSLPVEALGWAILYTTVLRELRLWRPPPGSASVAGVLPLWPGSGGTSRALLLSAESSKLAREGPAVGKGCSRRRGDAPSPLPSPGLGGLASAGSKASSSAGRQKGVSRMVGLAQGKRAGENQGTLLLPSPLTSALLIRGQVQGYN